MVLNMNQDGMIEASATPSGVVEVSFPVFPGVSAFGLDPRLRQLT